MCINLSQRIGNQYFTRKHIFCLKNRRKYNTFCCLFVDKNIFFKKIIPSTKIPMRLKPVRSSKLASPQNKTVAPLTAQ